MSLEYRSKLNQLLCRGFEQLSIGKMEIAEHIKKLKETNAQKHKQGIERLMQFSGKATGA